MDFGVVLQTDPPASRVVELARMAEDLGFSHVWTFDSHVLWQEPFVIYSRILAETERVVVGPMVTNPGTRDWTVLASMFATLERHVRATHHLRHGPRGLGAALHRSPTADPGDHGRGDGRHQAPRGRRGDRVQRKDAFDSLGRSRVGTCRCGPPATGRRHWTSSGATPTVSSCNWRTPRSWNGPRVRFAHAASEAGRDPADVDHVCGRTGLRRR